MSDSGTIRSVRINKVQYSAAADADLSRTTGKYATEGQATTGDTNMKLTKQVEIVEGVDLVLDAANRENLRTVINNRADVDLEYTIADGSTYTASGRISVSGDVTQDNKVTIMMIPRKSWTPIIV
ncbi:MAG: hypothetical protein P8X74_03610 [Reinekea sp.]